MKCLTDLIALHAFFNLDFNSSILYFQDKKVSTAHPKNLILCILVKDLFVSKRYLGTGLLILVRYKPQKLSFIITERH